MRDVRITDLFPEAAERYEEKTSRFPAFFIGAMTLLVLAAIAALSIIF